MTEWRLPAERNPHNHSYESDSTSPPEGLKCGAPTSSPPVGPALDKSVICQEEDTEWWLLLNETKCRKLSHQDASEVCLKLLFPFCYVADNHKMKKTAAYYSTSYITEPQLSPDNVPKILQHASNLFGRQKAVSRMATPSKDALLNIHYYYWSWIIYIWTFRSLIDHDCLFLVYM